MEGEAGIYHDFLQFAGLFDLIVYLDVYLRLLLGPDAQVVERYTHLHREFPHEVAGRKAPEAELFGDKICRARLAAAQSAGDSDDFLLHNLCYYNTYANGRPSADIRIFRNSGFGQGYAGKAPDGVPRQEEWPGMHLYWHGRDIQADYRLVGR